VEFGNLEIRKLVDTLYLAQLILAFMIEYYGARFQVTFQLSIFPHSALMFDD